MDFSPNHQNSGHLHNSTTVWTQPQTDDQRRYYSKHAAEKRVFGWITTLLQTAHGAIAFAAWTAIYLWVFKNIPFMLPTAPFLAGGTLVALHILFRTTWQTYWYDKLDNDPNTDSPVWVPLAIIVLLLGAEVQGASKYLEAQVAPVAEKTTEQTDKEHATTVASIEQAYSNDVAAITDLYKAKLAPIDRRIYSLRSRSTDTDVLTYAMFPRVAPEFFSHRAEGPKNVGKTPAQLADAAKAASDSSTAVTGPITYKVSMGGRDHRVTVERA